MTILIQSIENSMQFIMKVGDRAIICQLLQSLMDIQWIQFIVTWVSYTIVDPMPKRVLKDMGFNGLFATIIGSMIGMLYIIAIAILSYHEYNINNKLIVFIVIVLVISKMGSVYSDINYRKDREKSEQYREKSEHDHAKMLVIMKSIQAKISGDGSLEAQEYRDCVYKKCKIQVAQELSSTFQSVIDNAVDTKIDKLDVSYLFNPYEYDKQLGSE